MPIGNVSKDPAPKRESFRPPWVKDKDTEAPPAWTQRKLKPVAAESSAPPKLASIEVEDYTVKPLKPALKKQATIKPDKTENGVSEPVEEKLVKPSAAKLAEKASKAEERPRFGKPGLRTGPKQPTDDKTNDKAPALRSVRTIDDKAKEKSVTIVDKKSEKNGTSKANSTVNDKVLNNKTSTLSSKEKPTAKAANDKPATKTTAEKPALRPVEKSEPLKSVLKKVEKTEPAKPVEKPADKEKPPVKVEKLEVAEKVEEKPKMATKPPTPLEKTPSKLPPRKPSLQKALSKDIIDGPVKKWRDPLHERVKENIDKTLANETPKGHTLTKNESLRTGESSDQE